MQRSPAGRSPSSRGLGRANATPSRSESLSAGALASTIDLLRCGRGRPARRGAGLRCGAFAAGVVLAGALGCDAGRAPRPEPSPEERRPLGIVSLAPEVSLVLRDLGVAD